MHHIMLMTQKPALQMQGPASDKAPSSAPRCQVTCSRDSNLKQWSPQLLNHKHDCGKRATSEWNPQEWHSGRSTAKML